MPRVTRHLRVGIILVLLILLAAVPLRAGAATTAVLTAATTPKVILTELQTTSSSSSEEFVEFYNTTDSDIDFADTANAGKEPWKLQFFSATASSTGTPDWTKPTATVSLTGTIPAKGYYVLAGSGYVPGGIDPDQTYSSRLSDTGGSLQLVTSTPVATTYYDRLVWKQATSGQSLPLGTMTAPDAQGSLQRVPNDDSEYVNGDGTLMDFTVAADISPKDMWRAPLPPEIPEVPAVPVADIPSGDEVTPPVQPEVVDNTGLTAPYITELLPNPAAPLSDETDEFIELYNPNTTPFNLAGYTLEVGSTTLHDFTFADGAVLDAGAYAAFYSKDTRLSLANSGGQARFLDPAGVPVGTTAPYTAAADGASWSLDNGNWVWTTTATPDAVNVMTAPQAPVKSVTVAPTKTTIKKTPAKRAGTKPKGSSTTKTKATAKKKTTSAKMPITTASQTADAPANTPIHTGVLVGVVGLAVLYAAYEYRHDIRNRLYRLRHNRAVRAYARQ